MDVIGLINGEKGLPTFGKIKTDNSIKTRKYFIRTNSSYQDGSFIAEEKIGKDRYIITSEISEVKIHSIYEKLSADEDAFIARIEA